MDVLQKLGGRKFLMAIVATGAAMYLEMHSDKGLTTTMASFLGAMVATFHAANYASTKEFMKSKSTQKGVPQEGIDQLHAKIDTLTTAANQMNSQDSIDKLVALLNNINQGISEVRGTTGQIGTAMVNVGKEVKKLSLGGNQ